MRLYEVRGDYDRDYGWHRVELVWAESVAHAALYVFRFNDVSDTDPVITTVIDHTDALKAAPFKQGEHAEYRDELRRRAGFRSECDSQCESCELWSMDGAYPVCEYCQQCEECGHDKYCPHVWHETRPNAPKQEI